MTPYRGSIENPKPVKPEIETGYSIDRISLDFRDTDLEPDWEEINTMPYPEGIASWFNDQRRRQVCKIADDLRFATEALIIREKDYLIRQYSSDRREFYPVISVVKTRYEMGNVFFDTFSPTKNSKKLSEQGILILDPLEEEDLTRPLVIHPWPQFRQYENRHYLEAIQKGKRKELEKKIARSVRRALSDIRENNPDEKIFIPEVKLVLALTNYRRTVCDVKAPLVEYNWLYEGFRTLPTKYAHCILHLTGHKNVRNGYVNVEQSGYIDSEVMPKLNFSLPGDDYSLIATYAQALFNGEEINFINDCIRK